MAERTHGFELIAEVSKALRYNLSDIGHKVCALIDSEAWREFETPNGKTVKHDSFLSFVEAEGLEGLGISMKRLRELCADYPPAIERINDLVPELGAHGGDRTEQERNTRLISRSDTVDRVLARLKRDHPELAELVIAGELSANAAAVQAGFRTRYFSVPHDPERAADSLRKRFTGHEIDLLVKYLTEGDA